MDVDADGHNIFLVSLPTQLPNHCEDHGEDDESYVDNRDYRGDDQYDGADG